MPAQEGHLAADAAPIQGFFEQEAEVPEIDGLNEVVVGPGLHRLDGGLDGPLSRQEDRGREGGLLLQAAEEVQAVLPGMTRSAMTTAGRKLRAFSRASPPVAAISTR